MDSNMEYMKKEIIFKNIILGNSFFKEINCKETTFLLVLSNKHHDRLYKEFLNEISAKKPLSMMFAGECAEEYFDFFIEILPEIQEESDHVVTHINSESQIQTWVFDFLYVAMPSEGRFDDWKTFCVVCSDDSMLDKCIEAFKLEISKSV